LYPCRIVIADDHFWFRQKLKKLLSRRPDLQVVGESGDGLQLPDLIDRLLPDVILLDLSLMNLRGIGAVREIKRTRPRIKILILAMDRDKQSLEQAISAGARGYLLKEDADAELFTAIEKMRRGRIYVSQNLIEELTEDWVQSLRNEPKARPRMEQLSSRERAVLKLIGEGKGSNEIAGLLLISARTVERYRANIMHKLDLKKTDDITRNAI
jgi:two-component system response regulator NreC